jgi:hypothetical protein
MKAVSQDCGRQTRSGGFTAIRRWSLARVTWRYLAAAIARTGQKGSIYYPSPPNGGRWLTISAKCK